MTGAVSCGGHSKATTGPTTTLITADRWVQPATAATPDTAGFCTLVVSVYKHMAQIPSAATQRVREAIVEDYVRAAPSMASSAPGPVAPDAMLYFPSVARILADLGRAGLDPRKVTDPGLNDLLLDPKIKAAGTRVIDFVRSDCHYTIGG